MSFISPFLLFLLLGDTCFHGYGSFFEPLTVPNESSTNVSNDSKIKEENMYVAIFPLALVNLHIPNMFQHVK